MAIWGMLPALGALVSEPEDNVLELGEDFFGRGQMVWLMPSKRLQIGVGLDSDLQFERFVAVYSLRL